MRSRLWLHWSFWKSCGGSASAVKDIIGVDDYVNFPEYHPSKTKSHVLDYYSQLTKDEIIQLEFLWLPVTLCHFIRLRWGFHCNYCFSITKVSVPFGPLVFEFFVLLLKTGLLIFRAVAEPRISSKSAKSREIRKTREIPRNLLEILPNTCRHNIFESFLGC